jgi:hypothetical protein
MTAPELPPSQMNVEVWDSEVQGLHQANAPYYTADQMHAFYRQGYEAGMEQERARATCDRAKGLGLGGSQAMQAVLYEASIKYNGRP